MRCGVNKNLRWKSIEGNPHLNTKQTSVQKLPRGLHMGITFHMNHKTPRFEEVSYWYIFLSQ